MNWPVIVTMAVCTAVILVVFLLILGALNVTSPIARYAAFGLGGALGVITGRFVHARMFG